MRRQTAGTPPKNRPAPIMDDLKLLESQAPRGGRGRITYLERMAMLHGLYCGLTPGRIGAKWKMSWWTV